MKIRRYETVDCKELARLFFDTVHEVNRKDYSEAQLGAWADGDVNLEVWDKSFREHYTLIAEKNGIITGFADMDSTGYVDRLYIHKEYQRQGMATELLKALEYQGREKGVQRFNTAASITAKPFFLRHGYSVIREQQVEKKEILLTNFIMEKILI